MLLAILSRILGMRSISLACLVTFASFMLRAQQPAPLRSQLQSIVAQHHGKVALFAENLQTHETVAISPDEPVQTASVIKLAILYEALEQVRAGKTHLDDKLTLKAADQVEGSGVLLFFDTPLPLTLKDALTLMIVMSDNTATNLVIDHLGLANIDARIAALGLKDTYLYKKVFVMASRATWISCPARPATPSRTSQARSMLSATTWLLSQRRTAWSSSQSSLTTMPTSPGHRTMKVT
jgi:beta-lactamase class A